MKKVYLIGNSHLDPVWMWRKPQGMAEVLSTFRSALDRMREFPGYVFTSACAAYYQWAERCDPALFQEIQARVAEGRWAIAGGMWIQPDCNIPSGEAFARHALYSQRYFLKKFGITAKVGYNVDSFGHNGMLPQLLRQAGMEHYVFMRPDAIENPDIPGNVFLWESPDGSRVSAFRIPISYNHGFPDQEKTEAYVGLEPALAKALETEKMAEAAGLGFMMFYGVGNHGGGPTIADLRALTAYCAENHDSLFASTKTYFNDLSASGAAIPLWTKDLQHHASGCYAANSAIKAANRKSEDLLVSGEGFSTMAKGLHCAADHEDSRHTLRVAWEKVMFNQFHDILAGCSIQEATQDALDAYSYAMETARETRSYALQRIARNIQTTYVLDNSPAYKNGWQLWEKGGEGAPLIVFNPYSFPVTQGIQANTTVQGITDHTGTPVPVQKVRGPQTDGDNLYNTLFMATVPPLGYALYHMYKDVAFDLPEADSPSAHHSTLENQWLQVIFDEKSGAICHLVEKESGIDLCGGPMGQPILIENEEADTWAHGIFTFDRELGPFTGVSMDVLESGPLRASIRIRSQYGASSVTQVFSLTRDSRQLDVSCCINFQEKLKLLKLAFPTCLKAPVALYSMASGFMEKPANGTEEPGHRWVALWDDNAEQGLALYNDSRYSFSAKGGDLRMVAARSAIYTDHYGQQHRDDKVEYMDMGTLRLRYALRPFTKRDCAALHRESLHFGEPLPFVMEGHHEGPLPGRYQGVSIDQANIVLQAMKESEEGGEYVLRLVECAGRETMATVDMPITGHHFTLSFRPQEIKTLCLSMKDGSYRETNFLEL